LKKIVASLGLCSTLGQWQTAVNPLDTQRLSTSVQLQACSWAGWLFAQTTHEDADRKVQRRQHINHSMTSKR